MNKKILKIVIIAVVAVAIVAAIALTLTQGKGMSKSEIFDFVNNNRDVLIEKLNLDDFENVEGIISAKDYSAFVDFVCYKNGKNVKGFYYSPDDLYVATMGTFYPDTFLPAPDGEGYAYCEEDGTKTFYVEKISNNFFYYERVI